MIKVESTAISAIDYRAATRELVVSFRDSGQTYVYAHVPARVFEAFVAASSKGEFLNAAIKDRYPFRHLRTQRAPK